VKIEEQQVVRVDGKSVLTVWTDIETGAVRYEVAGQAVVNVQTPQGVAQAPVPFTFQILAENLPDACKDLDARIQEAAGKATMEFIANINAQQKRIQVPRGDQIIQFQRDPSRPNSHP